MKTKAKSWSVIAVAEPGNSFEVTAGSGVRYRRYVAPGYRMKRDAESFANHLGAMPGVASITVKPSAAPAFINAMS